MGKLGTGGMKTKVQAAKEAMDVGIDVVIAKGDRPNVLLDIVASKEIGTWFVAKRKGKHD